MVRRVLPMALLIAAAVSRAQSLPPAPLDTVAPVVVDSSAPAASVVAPPDVVVPPPVPERILVFPIVDSIRSDSSEALTLFRDLLVKEIARDTLLHGEVEGWLGARIGSLGEAESVSWNYARSIVWMQLVPSDSGRRSLRVLHRLAASDSVLALFELPFPDTSEQALQKLPRSVLLGLFPREESTPPTVSLSDSVKMVVVLPFLAEGTATSAQTAIFMDSLIRLLGGMDGFRVVPAKLRDSLLAGWEPGECLTSSCRQEVGERLGVPWVIAGRLGQLGEKWQVHAELVRVDSVKSARSAVVQCQGAPLPSLRLASGITARQLAGIEAPRPDMAGTPIAREPARPAWARILALAVASTLGIAGVVLSW